MRFIVACDGYGLLFELLHGLDPSVDDRVDSDGDGWMDWQEALAGTSPTDITENPWNPDGFPKIFSVTLSVLEAPEANVSVSIGDKTFVIPAEAGGDTQAMSMGMNIASTGGDIALWFKEGVAHDVSLFASADCRMRLGVSLGSSCVAFQNPHKVFTTGGELRGGARTASGMIAQPALSTSPEPPICFHTTEDMQVTSHVLPKGIKGTWSNYLYPVWSSGIGNSRSVSYFDTFDSASFEFHADEAPQSRYVSVDITRCALLDDNPGPPGSHDPEEPCECCSGGNPECGCSCHPSTGEPILYDNNDDGGGGMLVSINNDDDDASETEDRADTALELADNDLVSYYPLGKYDGTCCPCPEHAVSGVASSATLVSDSSNLRLWLDASKSNAFSGTINAGEAIYIEGIAKSSAVNGEELVWHYTEEGETRSFTNAITVLSQRIFADLDFDGDVDETDMALHPALSPEHGWVMPVNTNAFRKIQFRTDVGLTGTYTLRLSGSGVRVWQSPDPATGENPLLVAGQTVTNGVAGVSWNTSSTDHVYIEAFTSGTSILTYTFTGTGTASGIVSRASLKITAVEIRVIHNDADVTGKTTDVNAGERICLEAVVLPHGLAMNGLWEISGSETQPSKVVGGYTQSVTAANIDYTYPLFSTNTAFYWVDGIKDAVVAYHLIDGDFNKVSTGSAIFSVHKPSSIFECSLTGVSPPVGVREGGFGEEYDVYLEFGTIYGDFGIVWTNAVSTWSNGGGELQLVQLINSSFEATGETHRFDFTTSGYVLDSTDGSGVAYFNAIYPVGGGETNTLQYFSPGFGWDNMSDTPAVRLGRLDNVLALVTPVSTPATSSISRSDEFRSYLMYRPAGVGSIWITLRKMTWHWKGAASRRQYDKMWELVPDSGESPISPPRGLATCELPVWSSSFHRMVETNTVATFLKP